MKSPFANLFLAIRQNLIDKVPSVAHIDQNLGQLSGSIGMRGNTKPSVNFPCVLIDFEDFSFSCLSENVQTAKGTIVLQLAFAPYSNSSQATPKENVAMAIKFYDIEFQMHKAFQDWSPGDIYGSCNRISTTTQKRQDGYRVREIRYSIAFDDYSTKAITNMAGVSLVLTEEVV